MFRLFSISLLLLFLSGSFANAQEKKRDSLWTPQDTTWAIQDSLRTISDSSKYKAIEKYSDKSKITRFLFNLLFRPVVRPVVDMPEQNIKPALKYSKLEDKIIRNINIDVLDPFGYSIHDSSRNPDKFFEQTGNSLHIKTQSVIIQNLLLFQKYDRYDSLLVDESERLIRAQKYIYDVRFFASPVSQESDSVDIYIRALDLWSLVPAFSMSGSYLEMRLTDNNFAGLGHMLKSDFHRYRKIGSNITRLSYYVPNIRNSFISANLQYLFSNNLSLLDSMEYSNSYYSPISSNPHYNFSDNKNLLKSIELSRSFFTPGVKWAGGIFLGQMVTSLRYIQNDTLKQLPVRTNIQDYWGARSWQISEGLSPDGRSTNLIFSLRMLRTNYPKIEQIIGPADFLSNEQIYFTGIGITSRKYIRDRYIFHYGKTEDVPAGKSFGITLGLAEGSNLNRWYLGLKAAWGDYHPSGYLSTHLEFGTLYGQTGLQQGVLTGTINYFTPLFNVGNWKVRQFARPAFTFGINRLPTDNLSLNIEGFEKLTIPATHTLILSLQTQSYAPWNLAGFRFGPYIFTSLGMLGNSSAGFSDGRVYSLLGLGILIKNEYLLFNNFQFSLTFYPYIPDRGYNILKSNIYQTVDYGFQDFEISKPQVVEYR